MPAPLTHLLYLHGFRSSPLSAKAQRVRAALAEQAPHVHWWCPALPPSPRDALALLHDGTAAWPARGVGVVGSSLGGYYATVMAEAHPHWRAVLLNPAVQPARDLRAHIGEHAMFHTPEERFFFRPAFVDELQAMMPLRITGVERYAAVIAQGDEVLDWREMQARYDGALVRLLEGSDHALTDFEPHLPFILQHLMP